MIRPVTGGGVTITITITMIGITIITIITTMIMITTIIMTMITTTTITIMTTIMTIITAMTITEVRRPQKMRTIVLAAFATVTFLTVMTVDRNDANAVVCGRGPYRAGCVGPHGVVVAHPYAQPYYAHPYARRHGCWVWLNGVRVNRC
jgi:hypothetical protein